MYITLADEDNLHAQTIYRRPAVLIVSAYYGGLKVENFTFFCFWLEGLTNF